MDSVVYKDRLPLLIRSLGGRWRDGKKSFRMKWGELSFRRGFALELCLFDEGFSLHWHVLWINAYVKLPWLQRFAYDPRDILESWGASLVDGQWHFHWAHHTKIWTVPWHDWVQTAHDVRRPDESWAPYVGVWEREMKKSEPDGRHIETAPYRYLLNSGEFQDRTASFYVERRTRKLRLLRWLPWGVTRYAIDVTFSDEVGERSGSWKGGTVGCGYTLQPDETPLECLKRMERTRKF